MVTAGFATSAVATPSDFDPDPLASNLHHFVTQSFYAMNHTLRYQQNIGDEGTRAKVDEALAYANEAMQNSLTHTTNEAMKEKLETISALWEDYLSKLDVTLDDMDSRGYPDSRLVSELSQSQFEVARLAQAVYLEQTDSSEFILKIRLLCDDIAYMMTTYTGLSGLTATRVPVSDQSLDQFAEKVDQRLEDIKDMATDQQLRKPVLAAITKWRFIRNSFIHYNQDNINFLTNLYSQKIIENLQQATEAYIAQQAEDTHHQVAVR